LYSSIHLILFFSSLSLFFLNRLQVNLEGYVPVYHALSLSLISPILSLSLSLFFLKKGRVWGGEKEIIKEK